jgi:hypothetical protein
MTSTITPETSSPAAAATQPAKPVNPPAKTKKNSLDIQLKCMGILTLGFFGGVLLYTFIPEGPVRGMCMAGFTCVITYALFKFGTGA